MSHPSRRYLGIELAGAKNEKTAVAAIEYYPAEKKIFLLDIFDRISREQTSSGQPQSGDEALLELIAEFDSGIAKVGVNVPLTFPSCVGCTRKTCPMPAKCTVPAVKWMTAITRRTQRAAGSHRQQGGLTRVREFTPYTQRAFELWARYQILPRLPESHRFEIDETLGGNRAPLTARMDFLKRHLSSDAQGSQTLVEVWPKLTIAIFAARLGLSRRVVSTYRHLEDGAQSREEILEALAERQGIFIYERDVHKLAGSLTSFDAFICAYTALLSDTDECAEPPAGFPVSSGWVHYPRLASHSL